MKKTTFGMIMTTLLFTWGCIMNISTIPLASDTHRPAVDANRVEIYLTERDVPGEFEKIALIYAEEVTGFTSAGEMIGSMRARAARLGANGLILNYVGSAVDSSHTEDGATVLTDKKHIKTVAIYVKKKE